MEVSESYHGWVRHLRHLLALIAILTGLAPRLSAQAGIAIIGVTVIDVERGTLISAVGDAHAPPDDLRLAGRA